MIFLIDHAQKIKCTRESEYKPYGTSIFLDLMESARYNSPDVEYGIESGQYKAHYCQ